MVSICKDCKGEMLRMRNWSSKKMVETTLWKCSRCSRAVEEPEKLPEGCDWK